MLHAEMGGGLGTRLILGIIDSISTWAYASIIQEIWGILQLALTRTGDDFAHAHSKLAGASFKLDFAMSINPTRTSAYSEDLRWRMVWQKEGLGLSNNDIASNLGVDPSTVSRVVSLFKATAWKCAEKALS